MEFNMPSVVKKKKKKKVKCCINVPYYCSVNSNENLLDDWHDACFDHILVRLIRLQNIIVIVHLV